MKIRKAIFPVAGLGTRFLPATKANPKEMLPIVDKPLIQYAVEEAVQAGITELIFVTSYSKRAIEDHFDSNYELESKLFARKQMALLDIVQSIIPKGVSCVYVRQPESLGLGHAVLCAAPVVGDEPCAIILADDLIENAGHGCMTQMVEIFSHTGSSIIAVQEIEREETDKYGVIALESNEGRLLKVGGIIEKPQADEAPSQYGVIGRYILTPQIFALLGSVVPGKGGEIQLTDAIALLLHEQSVYGYAFTGKRYDCGSKIGYLEATLAYALQHPEIGNAAKALLAKYHETPI